MLARLDIAVAYDSTEGSAEIDLEAFAAAEPDPVQASAYQIRSHINRNHLGELAMLARAACGTPPGAAWMWESDCFGATLLVRRGSLDGDPDHVLVRIPRLHLRLTGPRPDRPPVLSTGYRHVHSSRASW